MDASAIAAMKSSAVITRRPAAGADSVDRTFSSELTRAQRQSGESYAVRKGDTLSEIVLQRFERAGKTPTARELYDTVADVARDNGLNDPNRIYPGQRLRLGAVAAQDRAAAPTDLSSLPPQANAVAPPPFVDAVLAAPPSASLHPNAQEKLPAAPSVLQTATAKAQSPIPAERAGIGLAEYRPQSPWRKLIDGKARLTSEFGPREHPITGHRHKHSGIDLAARAGTAIYPLRAGTVVTSGWRGGYGNVVVVRHDDGVETLYGHNAKNLVKPGDRVDGTTPMALIGSTGNATGPHLHFEVRRANVAINPIPFLTESKGAPAAGS